MALMLEKKRGFSVACTTGSSPASSAVAASPLLSVTTFLVVVVLIVDVEVWSLSLSSGTVFTSFFLFRVSPPADVDVEDTVVDSLVATTGRNEETGMGTVVPREGTMDACFFSSSTSVCCFLSMAARKGSTSFFENAAYLLV